MKSGQCRPPALAGDDMHVITSTATVSPAELLAGREMEAPVTAPGVPMMGRLTVAPVTLTQLKRLWGSAYRCAHRNRRYEAVRRDGKRTLVAATPGELLIKVRADYDSDPVPRGLLPCPCGWDEDAHDDYRRCPAVAPKRPRGKLAAFAGARLSHITRIAGHRKGKP